MQLERQQSKQNRYLEKFKHLSKSIKKTSRLIGYNANLLADTNNTTSLLPSPSTTIKRVPQVAKRTAHFETSEKEKQRKITHINSDNSDNEVVEKAPIASTSKPVAKSRANFVSS